MVARTPRRACGRLRGGLSARAGRAHLRSPLRPDLHHDRRRLMRDDGAIRLHLGCGERYLEGYVNVDFPPDTQALMDTSKADMHADLTKLEYEPDSVQEVRLHHVFEHFDRPTALRLLLDWYDWLIPGGLLTI